MATLCTRRQPLLHEGKSVFSSDAALYRRPLFYDPTTGRFNKLDSFAGVKRDPLSLHKYLYCHGDGVDYSDPSGWMEFSLPGVFGAQTSVANPTVPVNVTGGTPAEQASIVSLMNAAATVVKTARNDIDRLYQSLLDGPSKGGVQDLYKCWYTLEDPYLRKLMLYINDYFSTPSPVTIQAGYHYATFLGWDDLWTVVDTVDKIASAFLVPFTPFAVNIAESKVASSGGDDGASKLANVTTGLSAAFFGIDGQISIFAPFWNADKSRQVATLVHEVSHSFAGTRDYAYLMGTSFFGFTPEYQGGKTLDSWHAVRNADSYRGLFQQAFLSGGIL